MQKVSLQSGRYGIEVLIDSVSEWRWMFGETVTWQDAGSGSERSAADVPFATRSKVKTTDEKFGVKFFCSEATSDTSHG